ncbi:DUF488 domain-containing protein [uncultured Azohydromonas sp.]|jgi:Uncharacterized conserved protein|uniref:DUF488 domain-containing protein n=1 Tax=uncultured Azohydromonas sp. TaxID=487342 RepID=UPI00262C64CF|nr:DUF488 domain-containing protein [uncultured Azohydromonas sp.]
MPIHLKRAYDPPEPRDGFRILVDRLWPRGVTKNEAHIDLWLKDVAPSTELRKWFGHDPAKWADFQARYRKELDHNSEPVARIVEQVHQRTVTLVYGAKDRMHNDAVVLKAYLDDKLK